MTQLALLPPVSVTPVSSVYYGTDMCNIKIGRSTSPRRRGGELRVQMLLTFDGGDFEERRHHRMWQKYRIGKSEWFRADPELLLWLALNIEPNTRAAYALHQLSYGVLTRGAA
jgi:hypothetical protein